MELWREKGQQVDQDVDIPSIYILALPIIIKGKRKEKNGRSENISDIFSAEFAPAEPDKRTWRRPGLFFLSLSTEGITIHVVSTFPRDQSLECWMLMARRGVDLWDDIVNWHARLARRAKCNDCREFLTRICICGLISFSNQETSIRVCMGVCAHSFVCPVFRLFGFPVLVSPLSKYQPCLNTTCTGSHGYAPAQGNPCCRL